MQKPFDPQSTIFTNLALDKIMPKVSPNAWKILCFAIRKTAGWKDINTASGRKESDVISISQFRTGCGIANNTTTMKAIDECIKNKYLTRELDGQSFRYRLNYDYELPTVTETVIDTVTDSVMVTVTETVNTNYNINNNINNTSLQKTLQEEMQTPAKKNGGSMDKEQYKKDIEVAALKGMASQFAGFSHYPDRLVPVVERMERLWHFKPPGRKGKQYSFWLQSCGEILEGCAEFGVGMLDELHQEWVQYMNGNGGVAPYPVSSPKSLVSAVNGKAALLRGGSHAPYWSVKGKQVAKQSTLGDLV